MRGADFLSRWSRRKQETRAPAPEPAPAPQALPPEPDGVAPESDALTADEIAALPSLDALEIGSDLTQFLRAGVPAVLRNAALRRMWSLDPAIRDYLCEAREYAYDWNVPGGVPGSGPLLPGDDVNAMVARIFGDSPPAEAEPAVPPREPVREAAAGTEKPPEDVPPTPAKPEIAEAPEDRVSLADAGSRQLDASVTRVRRHGGAIPF